MIRDSVAQYLRRKMELLTPQFYEWGDDYQLFPDSLVWQLESALRKWCDKKGYVFHSFSTDAEDWGQTAHQLEQTMRGRTPSKTSR